MSAGGKGFMTPATLVERVFIEQMKARGKGGMAGVARNRAFGSPLDEFNDPGRLIRRVAPGTGEIAVYAPIRTQQNTSQCR